MFSLIPVCGWMLLNLLVEMWHGVKVTVKLSRKLPVSLKSVSLISKYSHWRPIQGWPRLSALDSWDRPWIGQKMHGWRFLFEIIVIYLLVSLHAWLEKPITLLRVSHASPPVHTKSSQVDLGLGCGGTFLDQGFLFLPLQETVTPPTTADRLDQIIVHRTPLSLFLCCKRDFGVVLSVYSVYSNWNVLS